MRLRDWIYDGGEFDKGFYFAIAMVLALSVLHDLFLPQGLTAWIKGFFG